GQVGALVQDALVQGAVAEEADRDLVGAPDLRRQGRAGRDAHPAADDAVGPEDAPVDVGDVHAAALALAVAGRLAEQLSHHQLDVAALGDAVAVAAVGAGDEVVLAQGGAGADPDRLFADVGVAGAAHDAFAVDLEDR